MGWWVLWSGVYAFCLCGSSLLGCVDWLALLLLGCLWFQHASFGCPSRPSFCLREAPLWGKISHSVDSTALAQLHSDMTHTAPFTHPLAQRVRISISRRKRWEPPGTHEQLQARNTVWRTPLGPGTVWESGGSSKQASQNSRCLSPTLQRPMGQGVSSRTGWRTYARLCNATCNAYTLSQRLGNAAVQKRGGDPYPIHAHNGLSHPQRGATTA